MLVKTEQLALLLSPGSFPSDDLLPGHSLLTNENSMTSSSEKTLKHVFSIIKPYDFGFYLFRLPRKRQRHTRDVWLMQSQTEEPDGCGKEES